MKKALALVEAPEHVCCRYRVRAFAPSMEAAGWSLVVEGLPSNPISRARLLRRASRYDAVVLQRRLLSGWHLGILRRHARRLIFDFDDAVLYRDSYDRRGPYCRRRRARFARTVNAADFVLAGNTFLARCATDAGAAPRRVRVVPTCVDTARYRPRVPSHSATRHTDLVWVGSSSTLRGVEDQRPLWTRLAVEVPGVRMRVVSDRFPDLGPMPVIGVPWSEATEADAIAEGDVGVSWVPDGLWSRGKCGLKVLQYQAAGLPVVTNPVGVHAEMVVPGETGFLTETADEWVSAVRALASDPGLRLGMGRAAREAVEARYSVRSWESAFVSALSPESLTSALRGPSWSRGKSADSATFSPTVRPPAS